MIRACRSAVLAVLGLLAVGCSGKGGSDCRGGGEATVARYEDCLKRCKAGDRASCNARSEVEAGLSTTCHRSGNEGACKALCTGRRNDQRACKRWRELKAAR